MTSPDNPATKEDFKMLFGLFIGLLIVLGVALVGIILIYLQQTAQADSNLTDQITAQTASINLLILELKDKRITQLGP